MKIIIIFIRLKRIIIIFIRRKRIIIIIVEVKFLWTKLVLNNLKYLLSPESGRSISLSISASNKSPSLLTSALSLHFSLSSPLSSFPNWAWSSVSFFAVFSYSIWPKDFWVIAKHFHTLSYWNWNRRKYFFLIYTENIRVKVNYSGQIWW